jgi:hypothetical protein
MLFSSWWELDFHLEILAGMTSDQRLFVWLACVMNKLPDVIS